MPLQPSSRSSETRTATLVQPSAARTWHPAWLLAGILLLYCIWTFVGWRRYLINQEIPFTTLSLTFFVLFDWAFWLVGAPAVWWISKQFPPTDVARFLVLHLPLSLLAATAAIGLSALIRSQIDPQTEVPLIQFQARMRSELGWYVVFYWLVVCSYLALDYHRALHRQLAAAYELQLSNLQLGRDLAEARLANLRHQLHPHFLFNALHSVSALMELSVPTARDKLIELSNLLRMSLEISQRDHHRVAEEADWLRHYLALEELRHQPPIRWSVTHDPATEQLAIPCLISQPLVENAIKHSKRGGRRGEIEIQVSFERVNQRLQLRVDDNGPGWPDHPLREGIGLQYVRRVLQPLGERASLRREASPLGGARVLIDLPVVVDAA